MEKALVLDFSGVYSEIQKGNNITYIDCRDIEETNMYCSPKAEQEIRKRIREFGPQGIHFLDSGNYHYITKFFADMIAYPFSLVLFDQHDDMGQSMIQELTSCGSWVGEMLRENPYLEQVILVGTASSNVQAVAEDLKKKLVCISSQEIKEANIGTEAGRIRTELPAYISIDKDVLNSQTARTNWDQGSMSMDTLEKLLSEVFKHQKVIGIDICGECSVSASVAQMLKDKEINHTTNEILYYFLSDYYPYRKEHEEKIMDE